MDITKYYTDFHWWLSKKIHPPAYMDKERYKSIQREPALYAAEAPAKEQDRLLEYIISFMPAASSGSTILDHVTNREVRVGNLIYCDGIFAWDESDIYHVMKYNMPLSQEFIDHVMQQSEISNDSADHS